MRNWISKILMVIIAGSIIVACEEDPDTSIDYRENYLGTWNVFEESSWQGVQSYKVEIVAATADDEVDIKGLYNIPNTSVRSFIDQYDLVIPNQSSQGFQFWGDGQANVDFDQVTLYFQVNDGTNIDSLKATLTR